MRRRRHSPRGSSTGPSPSRVDAPGASHQSPIASTAVPCPRGCTCAEEWCNSASGARKRDAGGNSPRSGNVHRITTTGRPDDGEGGGTPMTRPYAGRWRGSCRRVGTVRSGFLLDGPDLGFGAVPAPACRPAVLETPAPCGYKAAARRSHSVPGVNPSASANPRGDTKRPVRDRRRSRRRPRVHQPTRPEKP